MEATPALYERDAYLKEWEARVLACENGKNGFLAALDRTAFYPEGGGQFADHGFIGGVRVLDVHRRGGVIWHTVESALPVGEALPCQIDWERRFDFMQQHSGEHIFSGLASRLHGATNVGFHLGLGETTIDLDKPLEEEALRELELLTNEAVWKNLPVEVTYPAPEELEMLDYRSKKELSGQVRIVSVPGYDVCACCGTHVARTGEIGLVKVVSSQNYKGGTRLWMLCGRRALRHYAEMNAMVHGAASALSVKPGQLWEAQTRLQEELGEQKLRANGWQKRLFAQMARQIPEGKAACVFEEGLSPEDLRRYALLLAERCPAAAVFSGEDGDWKYAVAGGEGQDIRTLAKRFQEACLGRGGGKPGLVQGSCAATRAEIESFWRECGA